MAETTELVFDTSQPLKLTVRDMIDFEKVAGRSMDAWVAEIQTMQQAGQTPRMDWSCIGALMWVVGRKQDPTLTLDEALDMEVTQEALGAVFGMLQADPTPAEAAG